MRHAAGHDRHQFGLRQIWKERADGQRRFGLPHKNAGRDI